jgi:hypothetical protein
MSVRTITAGCFCGQVRLETHVEPLRVGICHCLDCRKQFGGIFYTFAVFPEAAVTISGKTRRHGSRHVCADCDSPVFDSRQDEIEVNVAAMDSHNQVRPTYETWTCRRERWLPELPLEERFERDRR